MPSKNSNALVWDAKRLRVATDAAGVALWSWNVDTDEIFLDERACGLWGIATGDAVSFGALSAHIHPEDFDKVRSAFTSTRAVLGAYEIDFRILNERGETRWISARGQGDDSGIVGRIMFGVFLDVTVRKQAEEAREVLALEMSHRVKNLFAIASSLTNIAARSAATTTEMARDLTQRLVTLGHAHDLIRPASDARGGRRTALLTDLFAVLLAAYDSQGVVGDRIRVSLPEIPVGESSTTTLALVVHELATNSAKYGALSAVAGTLDVSCPEHNGDVTIIWTERGGPPVTRPEGPGGFGNKLLSRSVVGQLGGAIGFDWRPTGLVVTLRLNKARLDG